MFITVSYFHLPEWNPFTFRVGSALPTIIGPCRKCLAETNTLAYYGMAAKSFILRARDERNVICAENIAAERSRVYAAKPCFIQNKLQRFAHSDIFSELRE